MNPITYADCKQSPYNKHQLFNPVSDSTTVMLIISSGTVISARVPSCINSLHISANNAYMSMFISTLILIAIVVIILAIRYVILRAMMRKGKHTKSKQLFSEVVTHLSC